MVAYVSEIKKLKLIDIFFNIIKQEIIEEQKIYLLPITTNTNQKKIEKIVFKLCKILYEKNIKTVVLSNNLIKNEILKEKLKKCGINIIDGKIIYNLMLPQIVETICEYKNSNIGEEKVTFLVNENNEINLNTILTISQNVKSINIVTNHINKFIKVANYLYEELGILIRISNNIKRDLLNSNIIINVDFDEELINKYYINTKAIVINLSDNIIIKSKKFAGININSYNIIIPDEYKLADFDDRYIYEGMICHKNIKSMLQILREDEIKIKNLVGKNGIINKREFLTLSIDKKSFVE